MADLAPDVGAVIRDKDGNIIPDEGAPVVRKKNAPTRSETRDDQELGLESGPVSKSIGNEIHGYPRGEMVQISGSELKRLRDIERAQEAKEMFANFGGQVAGSALTPIAGELTAPFFGKAAAGSVKPVGINALSAFAKAPSNAELAKQVIAGAGKKLATMVLGDTGAGAASTLASRVSEAAPNAVAAAGRGAATLATAAAPPAFGALSNNIERLRASAAGNPRAAELLAKITEYQPNFETVTQTNGVQP